MKILRLLATTMILVSVSGCAFFSKECSGDDCGESALLNSQPVDQYWYCYGKADQTWQCGNQPNADLIKSEK